VLQLFAILDKHHPHEPHDYLPIVGTRPQQQGRGVGTALLAPVLERCDREQRPAHLEATSARNRTVYTRRGFRVPGKIRLPDGPSLWAMWRTPQPS
jgi:GNAT superfamily N-acetyltransferase